MAQTISIPYFVEAVPANGYRATAFDVHAEGPTADEAEARLRDRLAEQVRNGGKLGVFSLPLDLPISEPDDAPYLAFAGDLKDDPLYDEWVQAMQDNRRLVELDPNYL